MTSPTPHTIRDLARRLGLSPTTVSEALRGKSRVARSTMVRVRAAAEQAGYHYNPLAGRVMSQVRTSAVRRFRGALALLDLEEPDRPVGAARFNKMLVRGVIARARDLGFSLDRFLIGPGGVTPARLNGVLAARGIGGVLVLPSFADVHLEGLDWPRLAGLYLDRVIRHPRLHSVSPDHFGGMCDALRRLEARGYRHPGLVLQRQQDDRLQRRWEGAFLATCHQDASLAPVPILLADAIDETTFGRWLQRHEPDVVLGHGTRLLRWMREAGLGVPDRSGFVSLNATLSEEPCAAIDLRPEQVGARGAELLVGQLLRGETGPPTVPCNTSVPAAWQEGPTVRPPQRDASPQA
jgi:DNA-binding LacI/PurR family transcriptional regulator